MKTNEAALAGYMCCFGKLIECVNALRESTPDERRVRKVMVGIVKKLPEPTDAELSAAVKEIEGKIL